MDTLVEKGTIIKEAALAAGKFMKTADPQKGLTMKEGRGNFFTAADKACEKIVIDLISKHFPQDSILSEEIESELENIDTIDRLWVIDPIDGTNNFANHRNYSCCSIGYVEKGVVKLAAVYNPYVNELFTAEAGLGAYVNGQLMSINQQMDLTLAYIGTDNSYQPDVTKKHFELILNIKPTPMTALKGSGVLAMCEVAAGRLDLYFHSQSHPWDNAAAALLVQEAGGVVRNFDGSPFTLSTQGIVVGNVTLVKTFFSVKQKTSHK